MNPQCFPWRDRRQAVGKLGGVVKLRIDHKFPGGVNVTPVFPLPDRRQAFDKTSDVVELRIDGHLSRSCQRIPICHPT